MRGTAALGMNNSFTRNNNATLTSESFPLAFLWPFPFFFPLPNFGTMSLIDVACGSR